MNVSAINQRALDDIEARIIHRGPDGRGRGVQAACGRD
jgi:hypothetical protein